MYKLFCYNNTIGKILNGIYKIEDMVTILLNFNNRQGVTDDIVEQSEDIILREFSETNDDFIEIIIESIGKIRISKEK